MIVYNLFDLLYMIEAFKPGLVCQLFILLHYNLRIAHIKLAFQSQLVCPYRQLLLFIYLSKHLSSPLINGGCNYRSYQRLRNTFNGHRLSYKFYFSIFRIRATKMLDLHHYAKVRLTKNKSFNNFNLKARETAPKQPLPMLSLSKCGSEVHHEHPNEPQDGYMGLGSVNEYLPLDGQRQPFWSLCKNRGQNQDRKRYDLREAERILMDNSKQKDEKIVASKVIAETMLKNIYGEKLKKIEQDQLQKQNYRPKDLINLNTLEVIMNEMEYNPRSQSIMLRKEELERLKEFGRLQKSRKLLTKVSLGEGTKIQKIYRLKNQYPSLKGIIIPTKSQQYEYFASFYNKQNNQRSQLDKSATTSSFFKTMVIDLKIIKSQDEKANKQVEYFQKFKAYKNSSSVIKHCPSRFVRTDEELVLQNIMEMKPPAFLFLLNQCRFQKLKLIKLKYIRINEDLLLLFLDCLRAMAPQIGCIQLFELSSIIVQSRLRFSEKLSFLLKELGVKNLKLDSMDLSTGEFNRIAYGLGENKDIEEISLRHNRIDILGVRNMEVLSKKLPKLRVLDVRNNDIPHYANLKDKSPLLLFF